ncbi:fungal-specific transcription factor domain-containing protein [Mycena sp. CBHHK59/15]|nr:fungal-specific transcription factor domain-containing protein [Mycena sp. CBHHK59/15]
MSSDEDHPDTSVPAKKRRIQRACDMCRRKKRACDGLRISEKKCTSCDENGLECTFSGGSTGKRKSYVDVLEARLELTEQLLRKLSPASTIPNGSAPSPGSSQWSSDSPILKHPSSPPDTTGAKTSNSGLGPGVELAALTIRSMSTPAPAPHGDDLAHIALTQDLQELSINQHSGRFHGKSGGAMLVKAAVQLREGYEELPMPWSSRRMHYWTFNPVSCSDPTFIRTPPVESYEFPAADLLSELVGLYFTHMNTYFPLLHRPTFERSIADNLHLQDAGFGAIVLLVCAVASRFSDDPRVFPHDLTCGWQYFDQLPLVINHLFVRPTLYDLQHYCLAIQFVEYAAPQACWSLIGVGIRIAQDVGAHREKDAGTKATVEGELWKRAFWVIVCMDRHISGALGRPCTTQYEDFDVDLPVECDDEFWVINNGNLTFKQPLGKPSRIAFFNGYIRLNNILAFSLKVLYSLNKTKNLLAIRDDAWEEHIVAELDSALNSWVDSIPGHLRWDPNRQDLVFFDQSAFLYCTYYQVQMTIHRPFIPMIRKAAPTALPSLAICTNAARSCSHVADVSRQRKDNTPVPVLLASTFSAGLVLLLNVWSGKRTGLPPQLNTALAEVHKCMAAIRICEKRWQSAGLFWDLLFELASIGQLPLQNPSPPSAAETSSSSKKRGREHDRDDHQAPYPQQAGSTAHAMDVLTPPSFDALRFQAPLPRFLVGPSSSHQHQATSLPTYTADLGRLPVYDQYVDPQSRLLPPSQGNWHPFQFGGGTTQSTPSASSTNPFPNATQFTGPLLRFLHPLQTRTTSNWPRIS